jgi:hypothetical protein
MATQDEIVIEIVAIGTKTGAIEIKTVVSAKNIVASAQRTVIHAVTSVTNVQNERRAKQEQRMPTLTVMAFQWLLIV